MDIRKFKKLLKANGFHFLRRGKGSHEIWEDESGKQFSFPTASSVVKKGLLWNFDRNFAKTAGA